MSPFLALLCLSFLPFGAASNLMRSHHGIVVAPEGAVSMDEKAVQKITGQSCAPLKNHASHSTVAITVGTPMSGTKPQVFDVVADTGSDNVIIPSCKCVDMKYCYSSTECFTGANHSTTFALTMLPSKEVSGSTVAEVQLAFGSGDIYALLSTDIVTVGGFAAKMNSSVLLMVDQYLDFSDTFNGILGLGTPKVSGAIDGFAGSGLPPVNGFLETAAIDRFSICFNDDSSPGVLGLAPPTPSLSMTSVGRSHWALDFHGISVGTEGSNVSFCNPQTTVFQPGQSTACSIIPDSGTTLILGQDDQIISLFEQLCTNWPRCMTNISASPSTVSKSDAFQSVLLDCNNWMTDVTDFSQLEQEMPKIFFNMAGMDAKTQSFPLTAFDYIMLSENSNTSSLAEKSLKNVFPSFLRTESRDSKSYVCFPAFGTQDYVTKANGPVWILGTPVFYRYKVVYSMTDPESIALESAACGSCSESLLRTTDDLTLVRESPMKPRTFPDKIRTPARRPYVSL